MAKAPRKRVPGKQRAPGGARTRAASGGSKTLGTPQERALVDVAHVLDKLDRPSAVIGGIAVIAWGFARFTADIDCAVGAERGESQELLTHFERGGFEPRTDDAVAFAEQNLVLLLRHRKTGVEVDAARVETILSAFDALLDTDRLADWFRLKGRR